MDIKITAKNSEDFKKIEDLLNKLPEVIQDQIESANFGLVGLECIIVDMCVDIQRIYLPNTVTQITDFDTSIGIDCGDYFFRIIGSLYDKKHSYVFIKCEKL